METDHRVVMRNRLIAGTTTIMFAFLCVAALSLTSCTAVGRPASILPTCRIGWAGFRGTHRRGGARRNMMHGWLSGLRKPQNRRLSSSSRNSTLPLLVGMHPQGRRDLVCFGQLDHVHARLVARRSARSAPE